MINQNYPKPLGTALRKERYNSMGENALKFNFDTESRGALFAPRQSYIYTIFTPEPCESTARAQTGYIGDTPMLLFFAILWGVPKNCINKPFDKSKFEYLFKSREEQAPPLPLNLNVYFTLETLF